MRGQETVKAVKILKRLKILDFGNIYDIFFWSVLGAAGERATLAVWRSRVRIPYAPFLLSVT